MKLCLISFAYMERGFLPGLIALSRQHGIELTLITPPQYKIGLQTATGIFDETGLEFQVLKVPIRFAERQGAFLFKNHMLADALDLCRPDIIFHEQEVYALSAGQVAAAAASRRIPLVMFVYENVHRKFVLPRRWVRTFVLRRTSGLVAASTKGVEIHRDWGLAAPATVLPQVGTAFNAEAPLGRRGAVRRLRLCYAGRLIEEKGVDVLLDAVAALKQRGVGFQCNILGRGPELEKLKARTEALDIAGHVHFLPPRDAVGVAALLRESDVHILCSRRREVWEEQFGRILIEAMAQATVCVGTDTGAIPEVLDSRELTFPEDDHAALSALLERLSDDDSFFLGHQQRLWQRARQFYTPEIVAERKIAFLRECLLRYHGQIDKPVDAST